MQEKRAKRRRQGRSRLCWLAGWIAWYALCYMVSGWIVRRAVVVLSPGEERCVEAFLPMDREAMTKLPDAQTWDEDRSLQSRYEILAQVMEEETTFLFLSPAPHFDVDFIKETTRGHFDPAENAIVLNATFVKDAPLTECVQVLLHECRHCYQWQLAFADPQTRRPFDLRSEADLATIRKELSAYVSSEEDPLRYRGQLVERDARTYAASHVGRYLESPSVTNGHPLP